MKIPPHVAPTTSPREIPPETELVTSGGDVEETFESIVATDAAEVLVNCKHATDAASPSPSTSLVEFRVPAKHRVQELCPDTEYVPVSQIKHVLGNAAPRKRQQFTHI